MAEFLSTRGLSLNIEEIIKTAKKELTIITPYLKFSRPIFEQLKMVSPQVRFDFIYGKSELSTLENKLLNELNCNIYFKENLHAKCFMNENFALISSMNFYSFSEVNNYEMGVLLNYRSDRNAYNDCKDQVSLIKSNAKEIRSVPKENQTIQNEEGYPREEFMLEWRNTLLKLFSQEKISFVDRNVFIKDFLIKGVDFDTNYGFGTFNLKFSNPKCERLKDTFNRSEIDFSNGYRVFWRGSSRIFLYQGKYTSFSSVAEEIEYCKKGLFEFVNFLKRYSTV